MAGLLGAAPAWAAPNPIALTARIDRDSYDLLAPVAFTVGVDVRGRRPIAVRFPSSSEYEIRIERGSAVLWDSATGAPPVRIPHERSFRPSVTILGTFVWNGLTRDGEAPAPGTYTVRVQLAGTPRPQPLVLPLRIIAPLPITALAKIPPGYDVTIAGKTNASGTVLTDGHASVTLEHPLGLRPCTDCTYVVRGVVEHDRTGALRFDPLRYALPASERASISATSAP